jgi:hypothetical protein
MDGGRQMLGSANQDHHREISAGTPNSCARCFSLPFGISGLDPLANDSTLNSCFSRQKGIVTAPLALKAERS